jgi:hypothetical protein
MQDLIELGGCDEVKCGVWRESRGGRVLCMAGHSNSVKESIALREPRLVTGSSQSGLCAIPEILDISHPPIPP